MHLNAIQRFQRLDLGQLLGFEHKAHLWSERFSDLLEQCVIAVGLKQHSLRQAADHHPFTQRNGEAVVEIDVRVGGEKRLRIGVGLGGLIGDARDFFRQHAARAYFADQFFKLGFHWGHPAASKGRQG